MGILEIVDERAEKRRKELEALGIDGKCVLEIIAEGYEKIRKEVESVGPEFSKKYFEAIERGYKKAMNLCSHVSLLSAMGRVAYNTEDLKRKKKY